MVSEKMSSKIFLAGRTGMVGGALFRALSKSEDKQILSPTHSELDLTNQTQVNNYFQDHRPSEVYLAAAKVGGIGANIASPAEFIYVNTMIATNVIHAAFNYGVNKLLFLGSSCIYPRETAQPMKEGQLLSGPLEPTNEPYGIAKILGVKLCESYNRQYGRSHGIDFRSVMPSSLYGTGDNYHPRNSHVIAGLLRRFTEAKEQNKRKVIVWGSGKQLREFLHVDDLAQACILLMNLDKQIYDRLVEPMCSHLNIGSGDEVTIAELANMIASVVGFSGDIHYDTSEPDGVDRKLLNSDKMRSIGWQPTIGLYEGLIESYKELLDIYGVEVSKQSDATSVTPF